MKSLYITSIERFSGKTAVCLALGKQFQADGLRVGYLKPLSLQPWSMSGKVADEDAVFVKETLGLPEEPWELSPVVLTPEFLKVHLRGETSENLMEKVKRAYDVTCVERDVLILEGGGSLREGYVVGLATPFVAKEIGSEVLALVKYRSEIRLLDDALTAKTRLGELLTGVIINRVPDKAADFVSDLAIPYLQEQGIHVYGVIPEAPQLAALTVKELIEALHAEVLTQKVNEDATVETLTVGAMTADAALARFRKQTNKAVITGGDRTDIQLAALETSTTCLVLTGNLHPSPLIVKQADEFGVSVLLVSSNTMETVNAIEDIFGKTRLGQPAKLAKFQELMAEFVDIEKHSSALEIK
ncbi:MAG: phosphotransacetylase family protein [Anaerolineales bacterium]|nr:phosphotransacetylase family protein [Anaerolineales bacterium]